ncbi:Fe-S cluster assembly protein SufD [Thiomonas arsenitoxydans]|jgi:Fe-S cluster assembly protein SufD|uniref:Fe-S cluster assembly protein SufD n=1 Tax=Thiomonas arsenitoxydans (strain DSM 22701 / CIP 110005 / 3As) TaxID=426114 RepID=UPI001AC0A099|nr:Fe-S cluster assembly protein SufD [Thiomonas arsenitoxydans]MBN8777448.1 Fe-S cluster assembly protein SufD [Thiomonas arsenitoxydans]
MGALEAFVKAFDAIGVDAAGEPARLAQSRRQALEDLLRSGLPTRHTEDWKYTSLRALDAIDLATTAPTALLDREALRDAGALLVSDDPRLVFVDGAFDAELSHLNDLPPGVRLAPWGARQSSSDTEAGTVLDAAARGGAFEAINRLFARDGMALELADGVCLAAPVVVIALQTRGGASHLRHALRLGQGSSARVIEQHLGVVQVGPYLASCVTRAELARGARLQHVRLQDEADAAVHVSQLHAAQGEDSALDAQILVLGSRLSRQEIHIAHEAPGCHTDLRGASVLAGEQHGDVHMCIEHRHPRGTSRTDVRGVFDDAAHGVFTGRVTVHPGAQKTDAGMINRNLLLSPRAEADTRPQLQIDADDVLCSHGAAVGQLDAEALFYLQSRGIAAPLARALLVQAFVAQALPDIGWEPLRAQMRARLAARRGLEIEASEVWA